MGSRWTLPLALAVAAGALWGGWQLSRREKRAVREALGEETAIPYGKVSSLSLTDYCRGQGRGPQDYLALDVRGCPPKAPSSLAPRVEAVVGYRNCSGIALIPK